MGGLSVETILELFATESIDEVYQWGAETLGVQIGADVCKFAIASDGLLVPVTSTNNGETGREVGVPIATTIPGSVFATGEGTTVSDLESVRGGTSSAEGSLAPSPVQPDISHRAMLCVPVGDIGVLVGVATEPEAFDEGELRAAEELGDLVATAIERLGGDGGVSHRGAHRLLEEIANMVSHDLRNKLNIMSGRLELAEETGESEHFTACAEALTGIESIAEMVVTLARTGRPLDQIVEVDLEEEVRRVFEPLNTPDSQLVMKASASILADTSCLSQLLENLFRNAIEHAGDTVCVEVGLLADGFYVADDGPGIPDDVRDTVFELGYTTSDANTGKGLAIVRRMAEAHGWDVTLTESATGGARIEIHGVVFR